MNPRLIRLLWLPILLFLANCQTMTSEQCPSCIIGAQLPLVSATELDDLSDKELAKKYPSGFSVDKTRASSALKEKLARLENRGLKIINASATPQELRALTDEIMKKGSVKRYFELVQGRDGSGFQHYLSNELLPYGFRSIPNLNKRELEDLQDKVIAYIFQTSHYWNNIGYNSYNNAPLNLKDWVKQQALTINSDIKLMSKICDIKLNNQQIGQLSMLMTLEYLSEAVRGLYYFKRQAPLTFYRQLAIRSLH